MASCSHPVTISPGNSDAESALPALLSGRCGVAGEVKGSVDDIDVIDVFDVIDSARVTHHAGD